MFEGEARGAVAKFAETCHITWLCYWYMFFGDLALRELISGVGRTSRPRCSNLAEDNLTFWELLASNIRTVRNLGAADWPGSLLAAVFGSVLGASLGKGRPSGRPAGKQFFRSRLRTASKVRNLSEGRRGWFFSCVGGATCPKHVRELVVVVSFQNLLPSTREVSAVFFTW